MSKSPVFGRQVVVGFSIDNGQSFEPLCELESFSYKIEDEVKENSVLGEAGVGSFDVLHMKVTCSMETKGRDSAVLAFFVNQQNQSRAGTGGDQAGISGQRGRVPYFTIVKTITYTDGSVLKVFLEDGVLHGFEESTGGINDEDSQKFEGSFTRVRLQGTSGESDGGKAKSILSNGISNISKSTAKDEAVTAKLFVTDLFGS